MSYTGAEYCVHGQRVAAAVVSREQWDALVRARQGDRDHGQLADGVLEWWELQDPVTENWYEGCMPDDDPRPVTAVVWHEGRAWTQQDAAWEWASREDETFDAQRQRRARTHAEVFPPESTPGEGLQGGGAAAAPVVADPRTPAAAPVVGAPRTPLRPPGSPRVIQTSPKGQAAGSPKRTPKKAPGGPQSGPKKSPRKALEEGSPSRVQRTPYSGTAQPPALKRSALTRCCTCEREPYGEPTRCKECKWLVCAPPHPCCVPQRCQDDLRQTCHDRLLDAEWNSSRFAG